MEDVRIEVYRNLHRMDYSIRSNRTKRVVDHKQTVVVFHPRFVVQPAGRDRVRREGKKNVHAYVRGWQTGADPATIRRDYDGQLEPVTYNPYKHDTFVHAGTGAPIHTADLAILEPDGKAYVYNPD